MGHSDNQAVFDGQLLQPGRRGVDASALRCGWVLPTESQQQNSRADCKCPGRERQGKPAESGTVEVELAQQRRGDDLAARREQPRRCGCTRGVAGEHEVGRCNQLLKVGRDPFTLEDASGFIGLSPRTEAGGVDPAGVDVRRARMPNKGYASFCRPRNQRGPPLHVPSTEGQTQLTMSARA